MNVYWAANQHIRNDYMKLKTSVMALKMSLKLSVIFICNSIPQYYRIIIEDILL